MNLYYKASLKLRHHQLVRMQETYCTGFQFGKDKKFWRWKMRSNHWAKSKVSSALKF